MRRMVGMAAIFSAMVLAGMPTASGESSAGGYAEGRLEAIGDWIQPRDGGLYLVTLAGRSADNFGGVGTWAGVARGKCRMFGGRGSRMLTCQASGRVVDIATEDFEMDPLLNSASVRVKVLGHHHKANWTGRGEITPASGAEVHGGSYPVVGAGAGIFRDAKARARLFGKRIGGKGWLTFAQMGQQAAGFVFGGIDFAGSEIVVRRDGTLIARRVIRLRPPHRN
jgi:hypothetical protein